MKSQRAVCHSAVGAACLLSLLALVDPTIATGAEDTDGRLELVLEADRTQLLLSEPVYVAVRLINRGKESVSVYHDLDPELGWLRIEFVGPQGPISFAPWSVADSELTPQPLAPNAEVSALFPIFYGGRGWTFSRPGQYTATAVYTDRVNQRERVLRSNSVEFEVREDPAGEFLIRDPAGSEAGKLLMWQQGDHLRKGIVRLEELTRTFPKSRLASYANLALGVNLSRSFKDYSTGQLREPQCEASLELLSRVRNDDLPASLRMERKLSEARCLRLTGKPEDADAALRVARSLAGERTYLQRRVEEETKRP